MLLQYFSYHNTSTNPIQFKLLTVGCRDVIGLLKHTDGGEAYNSYRTCREILEETMEKPVVEIIAFVSFLWWPLILETWQMILETILSFVTNIVRALNSKCFTLQ